MRTPITDRVRSWVCPFLVGSLAVGLPGSPVFATEAMDARNRAAAGAALSIDSDPPGAQVFVDGRARGATPLQVRDLAAGHHRVRVVKPGYLENQRAVTVGPGTKPTLSIRLSPHAAAGQVDPEPTPTPTPRPPEDGGGGGKKALLIGLGAVAVGAGAFFALRGSNTPPVAGSVVVTPGSAGIMTVTTFTLTAQGASDRDGDPITYTWNFGDGGTGSGQSATHVFNSAGTFQVMLTVSDGQASTTASGSVTVRDVNGRWVSIFRNTVRTWTFSQSQNRITGTYSNDAVPGVPGTVSGTLQNPRGLNLTAALSDFAPFSFSGQFNDQVTSLTGTANGSGFSGDTLVFNRQ